MNPIVFWKIIAGVAALFGYDQHDKRKKDQARFRQVIAGLEAKIGWKEAQFAELESRLGSKNAQVLAFAAEIQSLRSELANVRHRASA